MLGSQTFGNVSPAAILVAGIVLLGCGEFLPAQSVPIVPSSDPLPFVAPEKLEAEAEANPQKLGELLLNAALSGRRSIRNGAFALEDRRSGVLRDGFRLDWVEKVECEFDSARKLVQFNFRRSDLPEEERHYRESSDGVRMVNPSLGALTVDAYESRARHRPYEFFDVRLLGIAAPSEMRLGLLREAEEVLRKHDGISGERAPESGQYWLKSLFGKNLAQRAVLLDATRGYLPLKMEVRYRQAADEPWSDLKQLIEMTWEKVDGCWVPAKANTTFFSPQGNETRQQIYAWLFVNRAL